LPSNESEQIMTILATGIWATGTIPSFWTGAGALWIFSAAVSAMDPPEAEGSRFYGWLYRFTHLLAANLDRVLGPVPPSHSPEQHERNISDKENE
jgi:hypothetical protein